MALSRSTYVRAASIGVAVLLAATGVAVGVSPSAAQNAPPASPSTFAPGPDGSGSNTYMGHVDSPASSQTQGQGSNFLVAGWGFDQTAQGWAGFDQVQAWEGQMAAGGHVLASGTAGLQRGDVAQAVGNASAATSGFTVVVPGASLTTAGAQALNVYLHTPSKGWWYLSVPINVIAGAIPNGLPTPTLLPNETPTPASTSYSSSLPFSPDVHVVVTSPMANEALNGHTNQMLSGYAYDDRASSGQSGVSQVQVSLNGLSGNNGAVGVGNALLGSGGGTRPPNGYAYNDGFQLAFNPQFYPNSNPQMPWPIGGNVFYVYVYGINGAVTGVSLPFNLTT